MSSLSEQEQKELVRLMDKVTFPAPLSVFEAWCRVFGTVCAEVAVIKNKDKNPEIFLTYRKDKFFKGWHIPGRVHLPTEKIEDTVQRVLAKEVGTVSNEIKFFDWSERSFGKNRGQSARGHEFSFVFVVEPKQRVKESDIAKFFPIKKLPKDIMHHQLLVIKKLKEVF